MSEDMNTDLLTFNPIYEVIQDRSKTEEESLSDGWTKCHAEYDFIYRKRKSILNSDESLIDRLSILLSKDQNKDRYYYAQEVTSIPTKSHFVTTNTTIKCNGDVAQER